MEPKDLNFYWRAYHTGVEREGKSESSLSPSIYEIARSAFGRVRAKATSSTASPTSSAAQVKADTACREGHSRIRIKEKG